MSISTTTTSVTYAGNNSDSTPYPIPFKYLTDADVSVYFDGVLQTLGAGQDYTITGSGLDLTGSIVTNVAQAPTVTVGVYLDIALDQPVVLQETGSLPAKTIEVEGFDRLNMQVRRVWRKLQGVLTFSSAEGGTGSTGTADNLLGFDGSGDLAEIPNTTFAQTANDLSDLNDAATARTNLGVDAAGTDNSDNNAANTLYANDYRAANFVSGTDYEPAKGVDDNFVTDAEKVVIGNTSGTNTGDQVIPVSGVDFDPVATDNSTDVTKVGTGTYVSLDTGTQVLTVDEITETDLNASINASLDKADTSIQSLASIEGNSLLSTGATVGQVLQSDGDTTCSFVDLIGGGNAQTANPLSQFAATTSAELAGVISDETGTGALVFATSPTLVTPALGTPSVVDLTNATNTPLPAAGTVTETMLNASINTSLDLADTALQSIAADSITYDMVQDVTATDKILGRSTAGAGTVEEIACTSAGRALLDDADAEAQRNTLGANLVFDVRNYNTVGDGTTDDGVAIQAAITAAEASITDNENYHVDGATMPVVDLAGGVYGISETNKLTIARRIRFQNGTLNALGTTSHASAVLVLTTFSDGCIIDGVNIDGGITADGLDGVASAAISSRGVGNTIRNCKFTHFVDYALRLWTSNSQVIENCIIAKWNTTDTSYALASSRTGSGIHVTSDHNRIINCTIIDCGKSVFINSGSAFNVFYGCRFWSTGITTPVGGEGKVENNHVRNSFTNCLFDGVRLSLTDGKYEINLTSCNWSNDQDPEAIHVDTTATGETVVGLIVTSCFFSIAYASPITFNGTGTYAADIDKNINWTSNTDTDGASVWHGAKFGAGNQITGGVIGIADGVTAPSTVTGVAQLYVDTADGDLKVKFGDGTVKTISVDT